MRGPFPHLFLGLVLCPLGVYLLAQQPPAPSKPLIPWAHRVPTPDEEERLLSRFPPENREYFRQEYRLRGVRGTLSKEEWKLLRQQGIEEWRILRVFDRRGIGPAEYHALQAIGVNLVAGDRSYAGELAAAADVVLTGTVRRTEYHLEGPYHTWVGVEVETILKGTLKPAEIVDGNQIWVKQLWRGPHRGPQGVFMGWDSVEPEFGFGERVLFFLTRYPEALLEAYLVSGRGRGGCQEQSFVDTYATCEAVEEELRRGAYFELLWDYGAYRVVGNRAVLKSRFLRAPDREADVFDLGQAESTIRRVAEIQKAHGSDSRRRQ